MDQQLVSKEIFEEDKEAALPFGGVSLVQFLAGASETIPLWWSQARDIALRNLSKDGDHISGTVNTLHDMLITVPFKVVARNTTIKAHIRQADESTHKLLENTESRSNLVGKGWGVGFGAFINDYHTQDNGGWLVVEGAGPANRPIIGEPTKLIHLDSGKVWRTGSREFPAIFTDFDGKRHTIHHSRVLNLTSNPSSILEMYGVGHCAVSRSINAAQNLMDIANYKLEKLGSRPKRAIMAINTTGQQRRAVQAVKNALAKADAAMDNVGLTRYGQIPIVGINGEITLLDLASLPDGFNETESTQLGIFVLALAFGVDVRQLGFALGVSGQTKADAEVQHLKMRGKGPGTVFQETERLINAKFLPPHLKLVFDWQDDAQDKLQADIQETRSKTRKSNLETGATTVRVERENMVRNNEITQQQFTELELNEGRLSDGTSILALFESPDRRIRALLDLGIDDPLDTEMNEPEVILPEIKAAIADVQEQILRGRDLERSRQALAALEALEKLYAKPEEVSEAVRLSPQQLRSVTQTLRDVSSGDVTESTAIDLLTSIGITEDRAERMIENAKGGQAVEEVLGEDVELDEAIKAIVKSITQKPAINVQMPEIVLPEQKPPIVNIPRQEPAKV
jgi:hypothetical protein